MHGAYSHTVHISTRYHYIYAKGHVFLYPSRILHYTSWVFWRILMNLSSLVSHLKWNRTCPKDEKPRYSSTAEEQTTRDFGNYFLLTQDTLYFQIGDYSISEAATQRCSEIMKLICRRTPKYDFNKVAFFFLKLIIAQGKITGLH